MYIFEVECSEILVGSRYRTEKTGRDFAEFG